MAKENVRLKFRLNTSDFLISKALIDSYINHNEFFSENSG